MVSSIAKGRVGHSEPDYIARAEALAEAFAVRAAENTTAPVASRSRIFASCPTQACCR
jgi:hypothetical protein